MGTSAVFAVSSMPGSMPRTAGMMMTMMSGET